MIINQKCLVFLGSLLLTVLAAVLASLIPSLYYYEQPLSYINYLYIKSRCNVSASIIFLVLTTTHKMIVTLTFQMRKLRLYTIKLTDLKAHRLV